MDDGRGRLTGQEQEALREIGAALEGQDPQLAKLFQRKFGAGRSGGITRAPFLARISASGYLAIGTGLSVSALVIDDLVTFLAGVACFGAAIVRHKAGTTSPAAAPVRRDDDRRTGL